MHFVYSIVAYVAFSSCLRREDQFVVVVYFPRGHAVVMVNDPFSDLFFGSEKSVLSDITNPFLATSFPGFSPTRLLELQGAGRREPWERGCIFGFSQKNASRDKLLSFFVAIVLQQNKKIIFERVKMGFEY